jgi:hypothetical protein
MSELTNFLYVFNLNEIEVDDSRLNHYIHSSNSFVNSFMNIANEKEELKDIYFYVAQSHDEYFNLNSKNIDCFCYSYGLSHGIYASFPAQDLIKYNVEEILKRVRTKRDFTFDKYLTKSGKMNEIGQLKFLNDLLKQKTYATSKR